MKLRALFYVASVLALGGGVLNGGALAEVKASAPDGMIIQIKAEMPLDRDAAWARLLDIGSWWSDAHTYSQSAKSMSIDAKAGGCWCEHWSGGEVEHGRVVVVMPLAMLRLSAAMGPLQELGVTGALTFTLAKGAKPATTAITVDFVVSGSTLSKLDKLAVAVDGVLTEQVMRLAKGK